LQKVTSTGPAPRRLVGDRWFYEPVFAPDQDEEGSSSVSGEAHVGSSSETTMLISTHDIPGILMAGPDVEDVIPPLVPLTKYQRRHLVKRFHTESRHRRRLFKQELQRSWEATVAPAFDQENGDPEAVSLLDEQVSL
jgi:hypothetical protein